MFIFASVIKKQIDMPHLSIANTDGKTAFSFRTPGVGGVERVGEASGNSSGRRPDVVKDTRDVALMPAGFSLILTPSLIAQTRACTLLIIAQARARE
ncbi:MAG: hypothetical protein K6B45_05800 [Bacteroidaceae bacterium]|nr:hypothetical protein [Bacteroidaceae bacterium]